MIRTKLTERIQDVPTTWIFENYCHLTEKLSGQDLKIKSLFNIKDTNPSFSIYWNTKAGKYMFNDFSTGNKGTAIEMVMLLGKYKSLGEACMQIREDYERFIQSGDYLCPEIKLHGRYRVQSFVKRGWNILDKHYWTAYYIDSKLLEKYNIIPLESYVMRKDGTREEITIAGHYKYGYLNKEGDLCKIYQPMCKDKKFLKVKDYIQGSDQLTSTSPILVIAASMKDALSLLKMGWNIEVIVPDSENTMISKEKLDFYSSHYPVVCTMMDNDTSGIKAMNSYKEKYNLPFIHLTMEKDIAEAVKIHGIKKVKRRLSGLFKESLNLNIHEPGKILNI